MTRNVLTGVACMAFVGGVVTMNQPVVGQSALSVGQSAGVPSFQVDPDWPQLPNNWVLGVVSSVAVDRQDHAWVLHRPRTVPAEQKYRAAPAVIEFDANGKFVQAWGGPSDTYEWPANEHGITVDGKDNVWIGGTGNLSGKSDDMLLKFTTKGKLVLQVGHRGRSGGNKDTNNLKRPSDVFVYQKTNEAFVADGYGNRRVIVLDADTGAFKRMWGAFGNVPLDAPPSSTGRLSQRAPTPEEMVGPGPQQFGTTHGVKVSNDGLVYVGDRDNRRIQVFTIDGKYVTQVFINRSGPSASGSGGIAFSPDEDQRFMYLADYGNAQLVMLNRKTLDIVGRLGNRGTMPGDFQGLHFVATDSKGNLYTAEADPGNRAQRFMFTGIKAAGNATPAAMQERGGEDLTGPYDVVENWFKPLHEGWHHVTNGVFAETEDRVFVTTGGEEKAPSRARVESYGAGSSQFFWHPPPSEPLVTRAEHFLFVLDRNGQMVESWSQWDKLFVAGHKVTMNPYDPEKHVWVVDFQGHQVFKFTHDGKQLVMTLGEHRVPGTDEKHFNAPTDIAFLPDGSFFISDGYRNARVLKFDKTGKFLLMWGSKGTGAGQFDLVHSLTIDAKRRVYVADRDNDRVQIFDENGKFLNEWTHIARPSHVMISQDQFLWLSDGETNRILKYDLNGKLLTYWGVYGTIAGALNNPHHFSVDPEGNLYIAEVTNRRISKFKPKPNADRSRVAGQRFVEK